MRLTSSPFAFLDLEHKSWLERYYLAAFLMSTVCCLLVGKFERYSLILSGVVVLCFASSFFDDSFFLYAALFMYMRNKLVIGGTTAYRFYSYLLVLKWVLEINRMKFRVAYLPALLVFALHCVFATGRYNMRLGLNVLVDVLLIYIILARVLQDDKLMRRFLLAFLIGMVCSCVYGFTAADSFKNINIMGAGATTVYRNKGSLGDANYAGFVYDMAIITALLLKGYPKWLTWGLAAVGVVALLSTTSLSGMIMLVVFLAITIVLKLRAKSIPILVGAGLLGIVGLLLLFNVPIFRQISQINGILIRVEEKLRYLRQGRWDLLTTDRFTLWGAALRYFSRKSLNGKLFGGSVVTMALNIKSFMATVWACHQSYIQGLLNFGIVGTLTVYLPVLASLFYRVLNHFTKPENYENEDIKCIQIVFVSAFLIFGLTVDFFVDWVYLFFYFI